MNVGTACVDGGSLFDRLGTLRGFELRAQVVGGRGRQCRTTAAVTEERAEPETTGKEREQALHRGDATLPPLLATPVAPSPEAAYRRRGRFSP